MICHQVNLIQNLFFQMLLLHILQKVVCVFQAAIDRKCVLVQRTGNEFLLLLKGVVSGSLQRMCNRCFSASFPSSSLNAWLFNTSPVNSTVFMALIIFINNCSFSTESPQQRWLPAVERWITGIKWLPAGLNFTTRPASSGAEEIRSEENTLNSSHQKEIG